jgi:hypothetical protein
MGETMHLAGAKNAKVVFHIVDTYFLRHLFGCQSYFIGRIVPRAKQIASLLDHHLTLKLYRLLDEAAHEKTHTKT